MSQRIQERKKKANNHGKNFMIMAFVIILFMILIIYNRVYSTDKENPQKTKTQKKQTQNTARFTIENFPMIYQYPELPTGCEVTALTMVLNYYGYSAEKTEMAEKYLPRDSVYTKYGEDGLTYGNDLEEYFIGNPFSETNGISCGIPALVTAADEYLNQISGTMFAKDLTGTSPENLYQIIAQEKPVVVLVTISMEDRWSTQGWYTENGDYVEWSQNDHGGVLIGYTEDTVVIADPISGVTHYSKKQFERVYASRGSKSMVLEQQ